MMEDNTLKNSNGAKPVRVLVKILSSTVNLAVLLIFLFLLTAGLYAFWDTSELAESSSAAQYATYRPVAAEESPTFDQLKEINSDVFGWLNMYGTKIDYPLVQGDDNEKYVSTSVMGEYSLAGSLFLDYRNNKNFSDFNSMIYGHHMEGDSMFGELDKYMEKEFFDTHQYGEIYFDGKYHGFEVFAFFNTDAYDKTIYCPPLENAEEKRSFLEAIRQKDGNYKDIGVTVDDNIVLFSTCASPTTTARYILVGRLTDRLFDNEYFVAEQDKESNGFLVTPVKDFFKNIPFVVWIIIAIVLTAILLIINDNLYNKWKKRKGDGENLEESSKNK